MRQIPQELQEAIQTGNPLKKRILLQRRQWNAAQTKYELESEPIDISHLLVEAGSIKMALDTDEADKWDASNVTLTFANELNCFKEGLSGSLFEHAVLWGSKIVYALEPEGKPAARTAVFTGYIYTSPVWRENGRLLELTISSSLDALDYVSAEDFCLRVTDELATAVESENEQEQGKAFATQQTGVGYIDCVKYGADFASAEELQPEEEYEVSDLDLAGLPAVVKLKFVPTNGHKMWVSYRYWHKDMKIEDIVNALLDLAGVKERNVEKAAFFHDAIAITSLTKENSVGFLLDYQESDAEFTLVPQLLGRNSYQGKWNATSDATGTHNSNDPYIVTAKSHLPSRGIFFDIYRYLDTDYPMHDRNDYVQIRFLDENNNGIAIVRRISGSWQGIVKIINGSLWNYNNNLGYANNQYVAGFDLDELGNLGMWVWNGSAYLRRDITGYGGPLFISKIEKLLFNGGFGMWISYTCDVLYRYELPTEQEKRQGISVARDLDTNNKVFDRPMLFFTAQAQKGFVKWGKIEATLTKIGNGYGSFYWADSADNVSFSSLHLININEEIPSSKRFLRVYFKLDSPYGNELIVSNLKVTQFLRDIPIKLVNCKGLTVKDAIEQLAKLVAYEIGFDQNGVFFFRHRQGRRCNVDITDAQLIELDNHRGGIEDLTNRVSVEYGLFKTTVDDFTENKARPHSIDTYGVQEKTISAGNFVPADNVDISRAVALLNYEAFCTPQAVLTADCMPDLRLELGDIITVRAGNADLANPQSGDYNQFVKLPAWGRTFKVRGIELDTDKRKMTLELKDVSTEDTAPTMDYVNYQTQFPTPLNYKE